MEDDKIMQILISISDTVNQLDVKVTSLDKGSAHNFKQIDERFDRIEERMDRFEERMDRIEERMDRIEERMDRIEERMDRIEVKMTQGFTMLNKRLDHLEVDSELMKGMVVDHERKLRHTL